MKTYTHLKEFNDYNKMISNLSNMPIERLQTNINIYQTFLNSKKKFFIGKNKKVRMDRNCVKELVELFTDFVKNKTDIQPIANESKKDYIDDTTKTKTTKTTKTGDNSMMNKKEIAKIAPIAVKKIIATQIVNKTDTKKTYWGGWGKVMSGMNAAYNDYNKFQELKNQWSELRNRLGKGPKGHFCWSLINKNRVGVKQEPNSTLRFIKNVKIRIAMANDVLAGKYTETQINDYMNGLSKNYKIKYGLI